MVDKKSSDNSSTMLNEEALATMDYQRAESAQTNEVAGISKLSAGGFPTLGEESAATSVRDQITAQAPSQIATNDVAYIPERSQTYSPTSDDICGKVLLLGGGPASYTQPSERADGQENKR